MRWHFYCDRYSFVLFNCNNILSCSHVCTIYGAFVLLLLHIINGNIYLQNLLCDRFNLSNTWCMCVSSYLIHFVRLVLIFTGNEFISFDYEHYCYCSFYWWYPQIHVQYPIHFWHNYFHRYLHFWFWFSSYR